MRGLGGFVLLAGIGVGLFVYFPAPVDGDTSLEQAKRVVADRVATLEVRKTFDHCAQHAGRNFAPFQLLARISARQRHRASRASRPHR